VMHDLIIINNQLRRFGVRLVYPGMGYGVDDAVIFTPGEGHHSHADRLEVMVEFYDMTYASDDTHASSFGPRGQFVSRYYRSTLMERPQGGIDLMGYEPTWKIDAEAMEQVWRLLACTYEREVEALREEMKR
jgi:hypothetical protein